MKSRPHWKLPLLCLAFAVAVGLAPAVEEVTEVPEDIEAIADKIAADIATDSGRAASEFRHYAVRLAKTLTSLSAEAQDRVLRGYSYRASGKGSKGKGSKGKGSKGASDPNTP